MNKLVKLFFKHPIKYSRYLISLGIYATLSVMFLFLFKTNPIDSNKSIDPAIWGQFGDIIGGLIGSIFSLIGILFLYKNFTLQRKQISKQDRSFTKQQIVTRYYELLKIQRDNTNEITVGSKTGRKVFIQMERELDLCYKIVLNCIDESKVNISEIDSINLAYIIFYYGGISEKSVNVIKNLVINKYDSKFIERVLKELLVSRKTVRLKNQFDWLLFDGHQSRLGHYYRHLFQSINYINDINENIFNYREKYQYIKTLRAQLSTHEQVLLLWNSLSDIGVEWERGSNLNIDKQLITKYNLIKNIPIGHINSFKIQAYFPNVDYEGQLKTESRIQLENTYK